MLCEHFYKNAKMTGEPVQMVAAMINIQYKMHYNRLHKKSVSLTVSLKLRTGYPLFFKVTSSKKLRLSCQNPPSCTNGLLFTLLL
jgi:hypothetical protein